MTVMYPIYSIYRSHFPDPYNATYPLFNERIGDFLKHAEEVANDVLGNPLDHRDSAPRSITKIGNIQFGSNYYGWNMGNTVVVNTRRERTVREEREKRKKKDDSTLRIIAATFGLAITGFAMYKIPQWWNNSRYAKVESNELWKFKDSFQPLYLVNENHHHIQKIWDIAVKEKEIFDQIRSNANKKIALMVSGVAGATILILGAITAPSWISLGVGVVVLTGFASIWVWATESSDRIFQEKAKEIRKALDILQGANTSYGENYPKPVYGPGSYNPEPNLVPIFVPLNEPNVLPQGQEPSAPPFYV